MSIGTSTLAKLHKKILYVWHVKFFNWWIIMLLQNIMRNILDDSTSDNYIFFMGFTLDCIIGVVL